MNMSTAAHLLSVLQVQQFPLLPVFLFHIAEVPHGGILPGAAVLLRSGKPLAVVICNVIGDDLAGYDMKIRPGSGTTEQHEYIEVVLGAEGLGLPGEQPLRFLAAARLDLDGNRAGAVRIARDDVDPPAVAQGDRGQVSPK